MKSRLSYSIVILAMLILAFPFRLLAERTTEGEGRGVDSELLWPTPGPSHFATLMSSDVLDHKKASFSTLLDYYRKPLGLRTPHPAVRTPRHQSHRHTERGRPRTGKDTDSADRYHPG